MTVFIDTSAFYAILDQDDENHGEAALVWAKLLEKSQDLLTNNYVLLEMSAILQNRFGIPALRVFHEEIVPATSVDWVNEHQHQSALGMVIAAGRKKLSVVDCVSFQTMHDHGIRSAFCFDRHFREQGFELIP